MATLTLAKRSRPGAHPLGSSEWGKRSWLDFLVDGTSLYELTHAENLSLVGPLGWSSPADDVQLIRQFLLEAEPPLPGRQLIFVCPLCGDLGCGAITAEVTEDDAEIVWRNFAYENDVDTALTDGSSYAHIGPFRFPRSSYRETFLRYVGEGAPNPSLQRTPPG